MGIIISKERPPNPMNITITDDMTLTSTGAVNIHVPFLVNHIDFFPSSFKLVIQKSVIYIDPVVIEGEDPAGFVLITHSHMDHFSLPDIRKLLKQDTIIICPKMAYGKLSGNLRDNKITKMMPGDRINFKNITIEAIVAYNIKKSILTAHPRSALNIGYIISIDGIRVYHAGDTDYTPEMHQLDDITVALTPIDGGNLTMTTEKAAEFINHIKPRLVVPMHYNMGTTALESFTKLIDKRIKVIVMDGSV